MNLEDLTAKSFHKKYSVSGMTCGSCVQTITDKISNIPDVSSVNVSLNDKTADVISSREIQLAEMRSALSENIKYTVNEYQSPLPLDATSKITDSQSLLKTYKPLITVFTFILLVSLAYQVGVGKFNTHLFMSHIMAGFFIGLSFFKFLDLKAFSESFSSYDPIAQRWLGYGTVYPAIEVVLGLLFISGKLLLLANILTILVLSLTTYGVYLRLQSKSKFQCACLGTNFNLPLSNVTIGENIIMILMAIYSLVGL